MRILYVGPNKSDIEIVTEALEGHEVIFIDTISQITSIETADIEVLSVFVNSTVDEGVLAALPHLKFIATRSTGFDHIDVASAQARSIVVSNVPRYGAHTVAEYAFALMFALSRNAFQSYADMQEETIVDDLSQYEGFDLFGKTLGVVGTGAIGRHVCTIAQGLGMKVIAYDPYPSEELQNAGYVTYTDLAFVLKNSDIVSLHVPATPETHHMINSEMLSLMKQSAYLINTARGELVDTKALVQALSEKRIAGAGLDVLEGERDLHEEVELLAAGSSDSSLWQTLVADHALVDMPNVIVTPHIAFDTKEAKREILDITISNLKGFASGTVLNEVHI